MRQRNNLTHCSFSFCEHWWPVSPPGQSQKESQHHWFSLTGWHKAVANAVWARPFGLWVDLDISESVFPILRKSSCIRSRMSDLGDTDRVNQSREHRAFFSAVYYHCSSRHVNFPHVEGVLLRTFDSSVTCGLWGAKSLALTEIIPGRLTGLTDKISGRCHSKLPPLGGKYSPWACFTGRDLPAECQREGERGAGLRWSWCIKRNLCIYI